MQDKNELPNSETRYHQNGQISYTKQVEESGFWIEHSFNEAGLLLGFINSNGIYTKRTYDEMGNEIRVENESGYWEKRVYDPKGRQIYLEVSTGFWIKHIYDKNGMCLYTERSDDPKPSSIRTRLFLFLRNKLFTSK